MDAPARTIEEERAAFRDAITTRLWSGVPMNEHDLAAAIMLARVLGIDWGGGE